MRQPAAGAARFAHRLMVVASTILVLSVSASLATSLPIQWIASLVVAGVGIGVATTGSSGVLLETVPSERIVTASLVWSEIRILATSWAHLREGWSRKIQASTPCGSSPQQPAS